MQEWLLKKNCKKYFSKREVFDLCRFKKAVSHFPAIHSFIVLSYFVDILKGNFPFQCTNY